MLIFGPGGHIALVQTTHDPNGYETEPVNTKKVPSNTDQTCIEKHIHTLAMLTWRKQLLLSPTMTELQSQL